MYENVVNIATTDGFEVPGWHVQQQSSKLVIFVHGLTGHGNEFIHRAGSDYFVAHGYDTFRFDLYSIDDNHKTRTLRESSLATHASDVTAVFKHFQTSYNEIYLIGHSYGGLTLIVANLPATAYSLWDATFAADHMWRLVNPTYVSALGCYVLNWGCEFLIGKQMVEEGYGYTAQKCLELAGQVSIPTQLVMAECGDCTGMESYYHQALPTHEMVEIPGASHTFVEQGCAEQLFAQTLRWFNN